MNLGAFKMPFFLILLCSVSLELPHLCYVFCVRKDEVRFQKCDKCLVSVYVILWL